ncbi:YwhD family protein [Paenibacillus pasadenensis]|uniref:YwhD family protein n=1 Tax=Paenibacillus pasadenensis TaxID=217090 RepID=UPI00203DA2B7|nr:YwhD family protein [Paenibacillus pasadenensis]MCM3749543.1 YwhD family protein [Paenibacillus pasadenensis]
MEENKGTPQPEGAAEQPAKGKRSLSLNVVSNKEHRGFGAGTIDLSRVSSVIIDGSEAYIDNGAMHAKSKVEKGIKFSPEKENVPNGRPVWIVWVAVDRDEEGSFYAGATACPMLIDTEARRGWKILAQHVNNLDYSIKRRFVLDELSAEEKTVLRELLIAHNAEWWEHSPQTLKDQLGG